MSDSIAQDSDLLYALQVHYRINAATPGIDIQQSEQVKSKEALEKADFEYALKLQKRIDEDENNTPMTSRGKVGTKGKGGAGPIQQPVPNSKRDSVSTQNVAPTYLNETINTVHPQWELVDPTPDVFSMFARFDEKFFQSTLGAVELQWSKRMYSCAGICYQRGSGMHKTIIVRLSEPLLKLRSRKDLVETLLHEMIHAYCFQNNISEGNGGHGPTFKCIMNKLNMVAGTNITVYHSFHDEVNLYKTHVWRCNGICQNRQPFLGFVRRSSNRAPGPNDLWWEKHHNTCGGTFVKLPDLSATVPKSAPKKSASKANANTSDIRKYFTNTPSTNNANNSATSKKDSSTNEQRGVRGGHLGNMVFGLRSPRNDDDDMGQGYSMSGTSLTSTPKRKNDTNEANCEEPGTYVRSVWAKRFENKPKTELEVQNDSCPSKRPRLNEPSKTIEEQQTWTPYDEDVMVCNTSVLTIVLDSDDEDKDIVTTEHVANTAAVSNTTKDSAKTNLEISRLIKREIMEEESTYAEDDIILIDTEYDDCVPDAEETLNQSLIDELFGTDTVLQEFQLENDMIPSGSRSLAGNSPNDITICPICFGRMKRSDFSEHLEGCFISIGVRPATKSLQDKTRKSKFKMPLTRTNKSNSRVTRQSSKNILKKSGYSDQEIAELELSEPDPNNEAYNSSNQSIPADQSSDVIEVNSSPEKNNSSITPRQLRQRNLFKTTTQCPKCGEELNFNELKTHKKYCSAIGGKRKTR